MVMLGLPFSDPTAEGPIIQEANIRALSQGVTTDKIFDMVKRLREKTKIPLAFMAYANVVFSYGIRAFAEKMEEASVDALILPDIPFEEKEEFAPAFKEHGIGFISLIAPTSRDRVKKIVREAEGFIYCVGSSDTAWAGQGAASDVESMIRLVKKEKEIPCAVDFDISTPDQAEAIAKKADGVMVGSAIVKLCGEYGKDCMPYVEAYMRKMKEAVLRIQP